MCLCLCKQHPCKAFMMHLRTCIEMCTILINKKCDRGYTENIKVGKVAQFLCKDTCTQIEMYKMQCDIWQGYFPLAEHCRNSDRQLIMQDKQCREKVKAPADRSWRCPLFVSLRVTMPTPLCQLFATSPVISLFAFIFFLSDNTCLPLFFSGPCDVRTWYQSDRGPWPVEAVGWWESLLRLLSPRGHHPLEWQRKAGGG